MLYLDENVLIMPLGNEKVRLYHTALRQNTVVCGNVMHLLNFIGLTGRPMKKIKEQFKGSRDDYNAQDATEFSLWNCMLFNPDNCIKEIERIPMQALGLKGIIEQLERRFILKRKKEIKYPLKKSGLFDRMKGTLHQQLGAEALFRKQPLGKWWAHQKFNRDFTAVKDTPYKYIQECFLEKYFKKRLKGKSVLDVGCGTGYYCFKMAQYADKIIGIDYKKEYIDIAKRKNKIFKDKLLFFTADISSKIDMRRLSGNTFDYIFMIDILLLFFSGELQNSLSAKREDILRQLVKLLAKGGKIVVMDPSSFWLIPRFGSNRHPFGLITEYKYRNFKVIPTLEEITRLFNSCGLVVSRISEPEISKGYKPINEREYNFMRQFPQWRVFELLKYPKL